MTHDPIKDLAALPSLAGGVSTSIEGQLAADVRTLAGWIAELNPLTGDGKRELPSDARAAELRALITRGVKSLAWPVFAADGTVSARPMVLTLGKEEEVLRLWAQEGAQETARQWVSDARIIFWVALHDYAHFATFRNDLNAMLVATRQFFDEQILTRSAKELLLDAMDVLWCGSQVNRAVPAAAAGPEEMPGGN